MAKIDPSTYEDNVMLVELGTRIASYRNKKGISQFRLALLSDTTQSYISDLERGRRNPSVLVLQKIASALGVEVKDFFLFSKPIN